MLNPADIDTVNAVVDMEDTSTVTAVEASSTITTGLLAKACAKVTVHEVAEVPVVRLPTLSVELAVMDADPPP